MTGRVYAILLAAGFSSRFGSGNKLLAPFRGKPLAQHTIDLICGPCRELFAGIFAVYSDEQVAALIKVSDIVLINNNAPEKGQGESVSLGVQAAQAAADDFLFFFPCDQPFLDADTVRQIYAARRTGCIVEPCCETARYGNRGGSPCLFSGVFRQELMSLREGEAPRIIKARHSQAVIRVTVSDPLVLADIDDREMLKALDSASYT